MTSNNTMSGSTAYIISGYRLDIAKALDPGTSSYTNIDLFRAKNSEFGYEYYRGFYWSSSAGRWYQGYRGAQLVDDGAGAKYSLITSLPNFTKVVVGSYYYYDACAATRFVQPLTYAG